MSANDQLNFLVGLAAEGEEQNVTRAEELMETEAANEDDPQEGTSAEPVKQNEEVYRAERSLLAEQEDMNPEDNLIFFGDCTGIVNYEKEKKLARIVNSLKFSAPGELMRSSPLEKRRARMKRDLPETKKEKEILSHDIDGHLVIKDNAPIRLCDCLIPTCQGCHSECIDCGSTFCGPCCQKSRPYAILRMEISPADQRVNPYV